MAKHRRRRHYRGLMRVGFGALNIPKTLDTKDAAIGAAIGIGSALLARYAWNNWASPTTTAAAVAVDASGAPQNAALHFIHDNLPALGAVAGGLAAYFFGRNKDRAKAESHAVGAVIAGAAIGGLAFLQNMSPSFQGFQVVRLGRHYKGILVPDASRGPALRGGVLVPATPAIVPGYNAPAGRSTSGAPMAPALSNTMGRMGFGGVLVPLRRPA